MRKILVLVAMLPLGTCHPLLNPVDPLSEAYQGFPTVGEVSEVAPVSPLDAQSVVYPVLLYSRSLQADHYHVQLDLDGDFESGLVWEDSGITDHYVAVPGEVWLETGVTYYWRVRARDASTAQWGPWSDAATFVGELAVGLVSPEAGGDLTQGRPVFDWEDVPGAEVYRVQICGSEDFVEIEASGDSLDVSEYRPEAGMPGAPEYCWRVGVRNTDGVWSVWSSEQTFHLDVTVDCPVLEYPPDEGPAASLRPLLEWSEVEGAAGYRVQVAVDAAFQSLVVDDIHAAGSPYRPSENLREGTLHWRLRACNEDDIASAWTTSRSLVIALPVSASCGNNHTLVVTSDGHLWAWGRNGEGQLGDGSAYPYRSTPGLVTSLSGVVATAAGLYHSVALLDDGTVWTWGNNQAGQLGDGTVLDHETPAEVPGITDVTVVAGSGYHTLAVMGNGTLLAWGGNGWGQLGLGDTVDKWAPVPSPFVSDVVAVAAGLRHTLAIDESFVLWVWGDNEFGQLGDGTTDDRTSPWAVLGSMASVAAGQYHSLCLSQGKTAHAWGYNYYGQVGDGYFATRLVPISVLSGAVGIAGGSAHTLAVDADGTVSAWGSNFYGQLGDGTNTDRPTPTVVPALAPATALGAGDGFTVVVKTDGTVWSCGYNQYSELGDGTTTDRWTPVQVQFP